MTRVSIIICTRNRAGQLRHTLDAMSELELPAGLSAELLVIDSASTDRTPDLVNGRSFFGNPVRYIRENLPGLSRARNRGVRDATGEILLFTDDDVRPPKTWIGAMCAPILAGSADAVAGGVKIAPDLLRPWMEKWHRILMASTEHLDDSAPANLVGANMACAREVFDRVPGFDPEIGAGALGYGEEVLFSAQVRKANFKIAFVSGADASVEHHFDPSRLSRFSLLEAAQKLGRSNAYTVWHWEHTPVKKPRLMLARARARMAYYRLRRRSDCRTTEGAAAWEIQLLTDVSFFQHYLHEQKRPRRYEQNGLKLLTPAATSGFLKIGLLTDNYPGSGGVGGIGTYTRTVADELVRLGHEVHVFTGASVKRLTTRKTGGVQVWECPHWGQRREMPLVNAVEFTFCYKAKAEDLDRYAMMTAVRKAAKSGPFDVIESPEFSALAGLMDKHKYARRLAVRLHGSSSQWRAKDQPDGLTPMDQREKALALAADVLTVPTANARATTEQLWNCSLDRARVIGNPVRNGVPPRFAGSSVCSGVYFGRLEPRKGVDTIAAAIGPVRKKFPNFKLHFIGTDNWWPDGTQSSEIIRRIAAATGGEGGYEIHPSRFDGDLVSAAQNASFCVFPSRAESFGLVMLEAMAWGIPTIVSDIGPFRELAESGNPAAECCLLADPESPAQFAEKMCLLLGDEALAARMAAAGYEHARNWSVQKIVPALLDAWQS